MELIVEKLIEENKNAVENIKNLEETIANYVFSENEKDKVNFGNLCTALTGFRLVNNAMEALLANEDIVVTEKGDYYQKIKEKDSEHNDAESPNE